MPKISKEKIERVTLKLPKSAADYFRKAFPHGKRSEFVTDCLRKHEHEQEIKNIEKELRDIAKERM